MKITIVDLDNIKACVPAKARFVKLFGIEPIELTIDVLKTFYKDRKLEVTFNSFCGTFIPLNKVDCMSRCSECRYDNITFEKMLLYLENWINEAKSNDNVTINETK